MERGSDTGGRAQASVPDTIGYGLKRLLLGRPLVTEQLRHERLSNKVALGVLSPDAISSSAYGPEQVLTELLPYAGLAAFALVLPITAAVLVILLLVAASYRQVVNVYTRAGGSYVVARENFGPKTAQIAAAALLIDYVVTVAVQSSAGTVAVVSAIPVLGPYSLQITIGVVLLLSYMNLRGLREAGRPFAIPTYFFVIMVSAIIVVGVAREAFGGGLPVYDPSHLPGTIPVQHGDGFIAGATVLVLLRSFANGGSSLTGVEAISNTVSVFRSPRGPNARKVLLIMASALGFLVAGVSYLAYATHATPYAAGYPSVLSQEARAVFGSGPIGTTLYALVQAASALILFTGANTSFNGFPFLASFVAEDRFLPRQLTKRGHRLVFSNGIIVLTVLAVALLLATGGTVTALVPFYAIGVFTGFAMAGYGMTRHHLREREPHWRGKLAINLAAGILSTLIVAIFAIAKFTEGAWLVVILFPLLVFVLIRLNREYRAEAAVLERVTGQTRTVNYAEHRVFVFVTSVDLAALEALRYGRSLRPSELTAVHFVVDAAHADRLRQRWDDYGLTTPLKLVDCPDRRLTQATSRFVHEALTQHTTAHEHSGRTGELGITVLLPRRSYAPVLGRLLHDRSADRIARVLSRIPQVAATIIPYDVQSRIRQAFPHLPEERATRWFERVRGRIAGSGQDSLTEHNAPHPDTGVAGIATLSPGRPAKIEGRIRELVDRPHPQHRLLEATLADSTGTATLRFIDPTGASLEPGQRLQATGEPARTEPDQPLVLINPAYTLLETQEGDSEDGSESS
jgi:amino acid transporter